MKRNADLRSLRIDPADASLGVGQDARPTGFLGCVAIRSWLYTLRSAGAQGLDGLPSIDISLRWSERNSINMSPLWGFRIWVIACAINISPRWGFEARARCPTYGDGENDFPVSCRGKEATPTFNL